MTCVVCFKPFPPPLYFSSQIRPLSESKSQTADGRSLGQAINIFRLDFKAVIKTAAGEYRKVLIELQKAKHLLDIMRFRRYLADNYQKEDAIQTANGAVERAPLPIVRPSIFSIQATCTPVPQKNASSAM